MLYPFQQRWMADRARFKAMLKARQVGASWVLALEASLIAWQEPHSTCIMLSAGERQAKELMGKVHGHVNAQIAALAAAGQRQRPALLASMSAVLPNDSRVLALPANPETARGYSAHVFLDEFAFQRQPEKLLAAVLPTITRGGFCLRVASTPFGDSGPFYELVQECRAGRSRFSLHKIDGPAAVAEGVPLDLEAVRAALPDDETYSQEYLCAFVSDQGSYFPFDLLRSCVGDAPAQPERVTVGVDFGRHHDQTVVLVAGETRGVACVLEVRRLRGAPFDEQIAAVKQAVSRWSQSHPVERLRVDATGMGAPLAEQLAREAGCLVDAVIFTAPGKAEMATTLRRRIERGPASAGGIVLPDDSVLLAECHAIRREALPGGGLRFDARRDERGHADGFWALALAVSGLGTSQCVPAAIVEHAPAPWSHGHSAKSIWSQAWGS